MPDIGGGREAFYSPVIRSQSFSETVPLECEPYTCCSGFFTSVISKFVTLHFLVISHGMNVPHWFQHSPTEGHLGCFKFLAIMRKATINICA